MNDDDFLGQFAQYGGMTPMGPPPEKPKSALESVRMQKELERMRAEMAKLNPYPEVPRYEASISQRERDLATQMADMEKRQIATKRAEDTADMSLLDEIIAGGKAARLGTQAVVGGLTAPIAELFGVPADQYMEAAMSIPEIKAPGYKVTGSGNQWQLRGPGNQVVGTFSSEAAAKENIPDRPAAKGELARAGQFLDVAEQGLDYIIDTPVGQALGLVASLPMTPFNPATDRAVSAGLSGARAGVKLAGQGVKQAGQRAMEAGQNLSQAARAEFATPPTGAVQLQTQQATRNPLGMYSQAEQVALNLAQEKGTGNQFLAQISKAPGVKPAELEWTGLADFLKSKGDQPVTKQEIASHLMRNKVQVREKQFLAPENYQRMLEDEAGIDLSVTLDAEGVPSYSVYDYPSDSYKTLKFEQLPDEVQDRLSFVQQRYGPAQFYEDDLQLPGGSNYREIALTLPGEELYRVPSAHSFDKQADVNRLVHMRVNDRLDANGDKVLFVEEMQSDWGQKGKKKGFTPKGQTKYGPEFIATSKDGRQFDFYDAGRAQEWLDSQGGGELKKIPLRDTLPSAPFVQNTEDWVNLSLKRLITDAVNNGYKKVAFINGEQSASRYDLSKHIDEVYYLPKTNTLVAKKGGEDKFRQNVPPDKLADYIGKEAAEKLLAEPAKTFLPGSPMQRLSGVDLKVGGEGMKKFYDQIVPATANKLLKKLGGGKLEPVKIGDNEQLGFTITPEMVELVKNQGLPMFAGGGAVTMKTGGNPLKAAREGIQAAKKAMKAQRREERVQKNLEAYMGSKEKPKTYYHATQAPEDFEAFDLEKRPTKRSASAVFVTPSTDWASDWAKDELVGMDVLEKVDTPKPRIMPVITRAKNTFDYENPEHVQQVMSQAKLPESLDRQHIADQISTGNWNFIEDRNIQQAIKDLGFDSFNIKEKGVKNMGIFNPADVKALFNRGSYDPTTSDISKADGGMISADDIRQKLKNAFNFAGGGKVEPKAEEPKAAAGGPSNTLLERLRKYKKGGIIERARTGLKAAEKGMQEQAKATRKHPIVFEPAEPLKKEDIRAMAQKMAEQSSGQFVRVDPTKSVNPAGKSKKQFEREQALTKNIRTNIPERDIPVLDIAEQEGKLLVAVPGDPTIGGVVRPGSLMQAPRGTRELAGIEDVEFETPVQLYGGPRYGAESQLPEGVDPAFWASNLSAARGIQNPVSEFSQAMEGAPVLGMYTKMTPESSTYAMHTLDALLAYQQPEKLSKTKREQLTRLIKKGTPKEGKFPGFVGFDDPASVLLQARQNPALRKHISATLMKPTITQELKLPSGLDVLTAISHPEIENLPPGSSGFSVGVLRPGSDLFESAHPTYSHDIPGKFMGQTRHPIPLDLAFPRTTSYVRKNIPRGDVFNTMKMVGARESIDPQYIDQIKLYEQYMKELTGRKKGGLAKIKKAKVKHGN